MKIENKVTGVPTKSPGELREFQGSLKKIGKKQLEKLKQNILREGFIAPVFIWKDNILDGHHRLKALLSLISEGHEMDSGVPVVEIKAKDASQAAKYVLSYNSQYAQVTQDGLKEFVEGFKLDINDLKTSIELDVNLSKVESHMRTAQEDTQPETKEAIKTKIKEGDVIQLGQHVLVCGDCNDPETIKKALGKKRADTIITDPPYNLDFRGTEENFEEMANDNIDDESYREFVYDTMENLQKVMTDSASLYLFIDWRNYPLWYYSVREHMDILNCVVWDKIYAGLGRKYRFRHEFCIYAGQRDKIEWWGDTDVEDVIKLQRTTEEDELAIPLDQGGVVVPLASDRQYLRIKLEKDKPKRVPVVDYPEPWIFKTMTGGNDDVVQNLSMNNFVQREAEDETGIIHPTMKPARIIEGFLLNSTNEGALIYDPFGGSGSTLIACENTKRKCRTIEISPEYCEIIARRWEEHTGKKRVKL